MVRFLKILIALYAIACVALFAIQDRFIFNPYPVDENYRFGIGKEVEIDLGDGYSMNNLFIEQNDLNKTKGVILYLHGNRGNINFGIYQTRSMRGLGYDLFIPDYRSYGKTEGKIQSEKQLYSDIQKAYDYLKQSYDESQIILVGYSLGTGMASYLASTNKPKELILVAPFTSLTDIKNKYLWFFPDFLLKFKLPVKKFLQKVECPVTIVHGTEDRIVDYAFSEELFNAFRQKVKLITVHRESHRGIIFADALRSAIREKLNS